MKPDLRIARPVVEAKAPAAPAAEPTPPAADASANPTTDQILDSLMPSADGAGDTPAEPQADAEPAAEEDPAPEAEPEPDARDARIAELEAQIAARDSEIIQAKAAPVPTVADQTLLRETADALTEKLELARQRVEEVTDLIDSLGPDDVHTVGEKEYTRKDLIAYRAQIRALRDRELPNALKIVQAKAQTEATVRQTYPAHYTPNTPAAKLRASVEQELSGLAGHPSFAKVVAEVTEYRLGKASKPAPKKTPILPAGTAGKRVEASAKKPDPNLKFLQSGGGEEAFIAAFGG